RAGCRCVWFRARSGGALGPLLASAAFGGSAPPGGGVDTDLAGPPPFTGPLGSAGAGGTSDPISNGTGGAGVGQSPTDNMQNPSLPVSGGGGSGQQPAGGAGGSQQA